MKVCELCVSSTRREYAFESATPADYCLPSDKMPSILVPCDDVIATRPRISSCNNSHQRTSLEISDVRRLCLHRNFALLSLPCHVAVCPVILTSSFMGISVLSFVPATC